MDTFIGFAVVVVAVGIFLYFKNKKVKEFVDSRIRKPVEASKPEVSTPTPTQPEKPVVEAPVKPETPISPASTKPQPTVTDLLFPITPEIGAILDSRVGPGDNFGPLPTTLSVFPTLSTQRHLHVAVQPNQDYITKPNVDGTWAIVVDQGQGGAVHAWVNGVYKGSVVDAVTVSAKAGDVVCFRFDKAQSIWID